MDVDEIVGHEPLERRGVARDQRLGPGRPRIGQSWTGASRCLAGDEHDLAHMRTLLHQRVGPRRAGERQHGVDDRPHPTGCDERPGDFAQALGDRRFLAPAAAEAASR